MPLMKLMGPRQTVLSATYGVPLFDCETWAPVAEPSFSLYAFDPTVITGPTLKWAPFSLGGPDSTTLSSCYVKWASGPI